MKEHLKKLNLGCGANWKTTYPDYEGLDIVDYGQTWIMDIVDFFKYVNTVKGSNQEIVYDEIMANHFLEHFDQAALQQMFSEVHDILKPAGIFKFVVPHKDKDRSWVLPHKTFWNEVTARWLGEPEADEVYQFGKWEVLEVVTNARQDIHVRLRKI